MNTEGDTPPENTEQKKADQISKNPLHIGICSLDELEERVKAFRSMNQTALKKRVIASQNTIHAPDTGDVIVEKGGQIDLPKIRLLRRYFSGDTSLDIAQPDDGIVIISDMSTPQGISLTMDIVTQIMNLGGGKYEGLIQRIDSFSDFLQLIKKNLFPRLVIIGYIPVDRQEMEKINFVRARKFDQYIRAVELTHYEIKQRSYFPRIKQVHIDSSNQGSWKRFIMEVIREYTKPYYVEEF